MPKILFLTLHRPNRSPSQRFRFEQYLTYLEENKISCEFSYLLDEHDDKLYYKSGNYVGKICIVLKSIKKRLSEILSVSDYDVVFVQRECFMLGTAWFEKQFAKKTKLIFDFDDSIWLQNVSDANRSLAFLKRPEKTVEIIKVASLVIAGNHFLSDFASKYNNNVKIIPTTIDTSGLHNRRVTHTHKPIINIGWTGTHSTLKYFEQLEPVFNALSEHHNINYIVICDRQSTLALKNLQNITWRLENEIDDLLKIDIGIMPLPDDEWTKGKCGFKILQFMSLGIPSIASPVGVNTKIIQDGVNGFLCSTTAEWVEKISLLIEDVALRKRLGTEGRKTVETKYSVNANKDLYLHYFMELCSL